MSSDGLKKNSCEPPDRFADLAARVLRLESLAYYDLIEAEAKDEKKRKEKRDRKTEKAVVLKGRW